MRSGHHVSLSFIGIVALVVGLLATTPRLASAQPAPGTTRIGIVNPARVFNEMAETKALREKLEVRRKELQATEEAMRNEINVLVGQRQSINPRHPDFRKKSDEIDAAKAKLQGWGLATKASVDRDQKEMLISLYAKIEAATGEIAQKNGIDLVIADGRGELLGLEDAPSEDVRRVLNGRNVLYATKGVDLTEQVILLLDARFAQPSGVAPPLR